MPPDLFPVPPAERRPTPIVLPLPTLGRLNMDSASTPNAGKKPGTSSANMNTAPHGSPGTDSTEANVAVSPFINWIEKTPDAAEIAKRAQRDYSHNGGENTLEANDLFYSIRFPYVGNEPPPPGASAVIYSTPKK